MNRETRVSLRVAVRKNLSGSGVVLYAKGETHQTLTTESSELVAISA